MSTQTGLYGPRATQIKVLYLMKAKKKKKRRIMVLGGSGISGNKTRANKIVVATLSTRTDMSI